MPTEPPLGIATIVLLLLLFYGLTMFMSVKISRSKENADEYMTAGHNIGFGISAASMTATWIWASSMYASVTSGYTYGISGPPARLRRSDVGLPRLPRHRLLLLDEGHQLGLHRLRPRRLRRLHPGARSAPVTSPTRPRRSTTPTTTTTTISSPLGPDERTAHVDPRTHRLHPHLASDRRRDPRGDLHGLLQGVPFREAEGARHHLMAAPPEIGRAS